MPHGAPPPRVLRLQTPSRASRVALTPETFVPSDPLAEAAAVEGGVGLATALFAEEPEGAVALAVGSALVRGLPTAARLSLVTRGFLRDGCVDGQVGGGDLARRLASFCDGLLLSGSGSGEPLCLHLDGRSADFVRLPKLDEATPRESLRALGERFGKGAALVLGPARTAGFHFAGLTAGEIGGDAASPTSFLGRGGVGARFAALGLRALVITAPPHPGEASPELRKCAEEFARLLRQSPRLAERAQGGTLELLELHARAGELEASGSWPKAMAESARAATSGRHGCKGCPTPCGLVFDRSAKNPGSAPQGARFGALHAVTARLGLDRFGDGLELLARCDDLGLDAKETGLALYVLQLAVERGLTERVLVRDEAAEPSLGSPTSPRGDAKRFAEWLDAAAAGELVNSAEFKVGADALAARFGLVAEITEARRDLLGPGVKAQALSVLIRGTDSGRFAGAAEDLEDLRRYPTAAWRVGEEVACSDAEGRAALALCLQEDWIAATDALGICSFSCRALLEDGRVQTSDLARVLLRGAKAEETPAEADGPGERWLALGAAVCELQAKIREQGKRATAAHASRFERVYLALRRARQAGTPGQVLEERLGRIPPLAGADSGTEAPARLESQGAPAEASSESSAECSRESFSGPRTLGAVQLRSFGALAGTLGGESRTLELDLPASLEEVLRTASSLYPEAEGLLFAPGGQILPAVHRSGVRLFRDSFVTKGEILDLVLALRGG